MSHSFFSKVLVCQSNFLTYLCKAAVLYFVFNSLKRLKALRRYITLIQKSTKKGLEKVVSNVGVLLGGTRIAYYWNYLNVLEMLNCKQHHFFHFPKERTSEMWQVCYSTFTATSRLQSEWLYNTCGRYNLRVSKVKIKLIVLNRDKCVNNCVLRQFLLTFKDFHFRKQHNIGCKVNTTLHRYGERSQQMSYSSRTLFIWSLQNCSTSIAQRVVPEISRTILQSPLSQYCMAFH